eukprot:gene36893-44759_t
MNNEHYATLFLMAKYGISSVADVHGFVVTHNIDIGEYGNIANESHMDQTMFKIAFWNGNLSMCRYLLQAGVDMDIGDVWGSTALIGGCNPHLPTNTPEHVTNMYDLLIEMQINLYQKSGSGQDVLARLFSNHTQPVSNLKAVSIARGESARIFELLEQDGRL